MRHTNERRVVEKFNPAGEVTEAREVRTFELGHWEVMEIAVALRERADSLSDRHGDQTAVANLAGVFGSEALYTVTVTFPEV
jgi:hypothetical protein